ncbi:DEAD/DEAH box helicase domain [Dillenia turbinata]|uniref:DEAD/DEAH box helicase domain n=1 Tax=Dillenia turbinata TaxID=194707 RepID=A0AAN8ZAX9_9MAGN
MAKGDDAIIRKKNKSNRKKKRNESTAVSARVAAIIATKKRRKSGKRRICEILLSCKLEEGMGLLCHTFAYPPEPAPFPISSITSADGMCFSLPTPDDPFNDRQGKPDPKRKQAKKDSCSQAIQKVSATKTDKASKKEDTEKDSLEEDEEEQVMKTVMESKNEKMQLPIFEPNGVKIKLIKKCGLLSAQYGKAHLDSDFPSKFLILCLSSIQNALLNDSGHCENIKELFVSRWGIEFWKCYSANLDILETTGGCSNEEQIAWMVSSAADTISRKEKECLSIAYPFLLYIVPSRERASKVRSVCKPLKALGIHTVSLHSGASLDHQVHGLKSCEPEFLVSTPERLLELVKLKATDISGVSLLVVDGLETLCKDGHLDTIRSIRQLISASTNSVVFSESFSPASAQAVQHLSVGSFCRLSLNNSVASQSAFICQSVHVCSSEEEKLSKICREQ